VRGDTCLANRDAIHPQAAKGDALQLVITDGWALYGVPRGR
jgi:hypothetical protein